MSNNQDSPSTLRAGIDQKGRKKKTGLFIAIVAIAVALIAAIIIWAVSSSAQPNANDDSTPGESPSGESSAPAERYSLKLATAEDTAFQDAIKLVAAEKGLDVEWVNVDDWVLPNTELVAGTVDGNAFQHILYLSAFNVEHGADLTPVFSTVITQWGVFSATLDDLESIPEGGRIAIPDDPSNGGRALYILEAAGLIGISEDAGDFPTVSDVADNPRNLTFVELGARTIPQNFDDPSLSAVVVGTSYFDPTQNVSAADALYLDDSLAEQNLPYVNVVASRDDNKDEPAWAILEEAYADPRVAEALEKESFGNTVLVKVPVETLRAKLADLQAAVR